MIADLHVEVQGGYIIITLPGTGYSIAYFKAAGEPRLIPKSQSDQPDHSFPMTQAEFQAQAWELATNKARELGWIV